MSRDSASLWVRVGNPPRLVNLAQAVAVLTEEQAGRCYLVAQLSDGQLHTLVSHSFQDWKDAKARDAANRRVMAAFERLAAYLGARELKALKMPKAGDDGGDEGDNE